MVKASGLVLVLALWIPTVWSAELPSGESSTALVPLAEPDVSCDIALSDVKMNTVALPAVPEDLSSPAARSAFTLQMNTTLSHNADAMSRAFQGISAETRDPNFTASRRQMAISNDPKVKNMLTLFSDFNGVAALIAPPPTFTPAEAVVGAKAAFRGLIKRVGLVGELPPTLQQWLSLVSNERPNFERMYDAVDIAAREVEKRTRENLIEIRRMQLTVELSEVELAAYKAQATEIKKKMETAELDEAGRKDLERTNLVPLTRQIQNTGEFIGVHKLIAEQKKESVLAMWDALSNVQNAIRLAVPILENTAVNYDDNMFTGGLISGTEKLRQIMGGALDVGNKTLENTLVANDKLATSPQVADLIDKVGTFVRIMNEHDDRLSQALPKLEARIKSADTALEKLDRRSVDLKLLEYKPAAQSDLP